uniref:ATP synthase subunit a n=1 Tax=Acanthosaura armata TaxID=285987 RepID=D6RR86_9SAUR|nr:ATPase subunit 6 [Acanthosaura armata]
MTLDLFHQFNTPQVLNTTLLPMIMLCLTTTACIETNQLKNNRLTVFYTWILKKTMKTVTSKTSLLGQKWTPMLAALLLLLVVTNSTGILPYTNTPTTLLSMNMALATPLWLGTVLVGLRNYPTRSAAHLLPESTPTSLTPVLIIIETASLIMRPLALGVRLTANLTAGHLLLHLISLALALSTNISPTATLVTTIFLVLLTALEMAVALIQAYVFSLLVSLYLQENTYDTPNTPIPHSNSKPLTYPCRHLNTSPRLGTSNMNAPKNNSTSNP